MILCCHAYFSSELVAILRNLTNITQAWTKCAKVIDSQSFRLFQLTEVKLRANRKLHSYYFFSTWFARRFFAKQKGTDQLSIENYTECRAIKSAIHYWFHWFWMHTEVAVFNIYLNCRKKVRTGFVPCKKNKKKCLQTSLGMRPASVLWTATMEAISKKVKSSFQALMLPRSIQIQLWKGTSH